MGDPPNFGLWLLLTLHSDLAGYMNDVYNEETHSWEWGLKKLNIFTDFLQSATNLREVHLRIDLDNSVNQLHVAPFITQWPLWLETRQSCGFLRARDVRQHPGSLCLRTFLRLVNAPFEQGFTQMASRAAPAAPKPYNSLGF